MTRRAGRRSALQTVSAAGRDPYPPVPPPPPALRRLALACYALFAAGALIWNAIAGRPAIALLWDPRRATAALAAVGIAAGAALGVLTISLTRLCVQRTRWGADLYRWFAAALGPVSWRDAAWLATLSAIGEELLFRGAMQPDLGIALTTLIFAALHCPPRLRLISWTLAAGLLGLAFGALTSWTGNLGAALTAHFTINLVNLRMVSRFADVARDGAKLAPPGADP